ncbi:MAG: DNA polymerase II large subunit [Promethearchaeota archaeon]
MKPVASVKMNEYSDKISKDVEFIYEIAEKARKKGIDPTTEIECPPAHDLAGRVESLVGPKGVADRIRLFKENGLDQDEIAFKIGTEIIDRKLGNFSDKEERVDRAIRVALAIETMGVVSAPLEGISSIRIRENLNGGLPYLSIYFAGPIRGAGGTVQALAILIADYFRSKMNIAPYKATEEEIGRMIEEVKLYERISNLQYPATKEELEFAIKNLKVEINGDPTKKREVSQYRNLNRIETNFVRGGACLVLNDGLLLKSKKVLIIIDKMKISGWDWLKEIKKYSHSDENNEISETENEDIEKISNNEITPVEKWKKKLEEKIAPIHKYIAEVLGGRPVFADPSERGGFRIRYGRSRNTGLAGCGINPTTMYILNEFLAVGTQIKIERPGKAASVMPVTSIEGPVCLLKNGDVIQFNRLNSIKEITNDNPVKKILFIGDLLFGFGEFVENNHILVPSGYVEEWWALELEKAFKNSKKDFKEQTIINIQNWITNPFNSRPSGIQSIKLSKILKIPLHPHYTFHFANVNGYDLLNFRREIKLYYREKGLNLLKTSKLRIPNNAVCKSFLYHIYCPHFNKKEFLELNEDLTQVFIEILALEEKFSPQKSSELEKLSRELIALELFERITSIKVKNKAPYYMGARMGRPEKAHERKMNPPVHTLFPLGHNGKNRTLQKVLSSIEAEIVLRQCEKCGKFTYLNSCEQCNQRTVIRKYCTMCKSVYNLDQNNCPNCNRPLHGYNIRKINFINEFNIFLRKLHTSKIPDVKGVKGLMSRFKIAEPIEKGILRAKNEVWVFKDGTIRFDAIDIPFTHFTPREINTSVEKLREMGYDTDYLGEQLKNPKQICELKCQDFIATEYCGDYFLRVSKFLDDELEFIYELPRFYKCKTRKDLIGHYFAGLAPHTSAAIVGRLIGYTPINAGYAHPYWHAAKRRNADGDEDGLMLLLDCLINFSRFYLPSKIGGKMDAPLVLSVILDPNEIDSEAQNIDTLPKYPIEFYEETLHYEKPAIIKEKLDMGLVKSRLGRTEQYEGIKFTHPTKNISYGPKISQYKRLKTMSDKIESQLTLASKIEAVNDTNVARKILHSHFFRDISGNLRKFSQQEFRCPSCSEKYRRVPLSGKCNKCGGKLLLTVTKGGIAKYLDKSLEISEDYNLGDYTTQRIKLMKEYVTSLTDNPKVKQIKITSYFK